MALGQDDWKHKYKELAQECELLQQRAERFHAQARALSAQLTLGLRGYSAELDAQFDQLRDLMHEADAGNRFDQVLGQIERQIKQLDDQRLSISKELRTGFGRWLEQLRQLNRSSAVSSRLDATEQRIPEASEHLYQLAQLVFEMVELQQGLLSAAGTDEQLFALNKTSQDAAIDLQVIERRVATEILRLIAALNVESQALAQQLGERVGRGLCAAELPEVMGQLVQLVELSTGLEHQAFGNYLLQLKEQLLYVQEHLAQSHAEDGRVLKAQQQLDRQVRQDVSRLHHSVKESTDLADLKRTVAQQLLSIVQTMDAHREREETHERRMRARYESLLEKVGQMQDETERVRLRMEEEQQRSHTDPLTGLPNRVAYDERLSAELERWQRYNTPFSIAVVDLDRFKAINDEYGHLAGDKVLRLVARILQRNMRSNDFIVRYGGEEFVLLFPSTLAEDALLAADKLREAVENSPFNFHGQPVQVTASFGVAQVTAGDDAESLFARADGALYGAKERGRNQVFGGKS